MEVHLRGRLGLRNAGLWSWEQRVAKGAAVSYLWDLSVLHLQAA